MDLTTSTSASGDDTLISVEFSGESDPAKLPFLLHPSPKTFLLDDLCNLRLNLKWCALDHSSFLRRAVSYLAFLLLAVAVPLIGVLYVRVPQEDTSGVAFDKLAQLPGSALAAIAFFTLSVFLRKYGIRHLLFLDELREDSPYVRQGYARQLQRAFRYLTCILLPSFAVEVAHKVIFFSTVSVHFPGANCRIPANSVMFVAVLAAWVYRTGVFLLVCVLFRLTCELQILRLEGFRKGLEAGCGADAGVVFREHMRIKKQLLVTSHRYRIFILGCLVTITVSQLGALMLVLASKSEKNFFNSGDLVVCSAVQLSGFFMCLIGAAKITHRAQGVVAIATRWHMLLTCVRPGKDSVVPQLDCAGNSQPLDECIKVQFQATSSFEARQALVTYLQHNNGGITLFGFTLDRGLLHTLFVFEMSLVLWILSKVIVIS